MKKTILITIIVMLLLVLTVHSLEFNITVLDVVTGQGGITDIDFGTNPDVLFGVLSANSLLVSYNISNSSDITIISTFDFETSVLDFASANRIEVDNNNIATIAFPLNSSFAIMNVSNAESMTILGNITQNELLNRFRNHKKVGDFVYGASGEANAFIIINVSNLRNPFISSNITGAGSPNFLDFPWDVGIQNDIAYVASGSDVGVTIINVTDKRNPFVINHTPVGQTGFGESFANSLSVRDNLVVVDTCDFDGSETVTLLDVTNPVSPVILDSISSTQLGAPDFIGCGNDFEFSDTVGFTDILFHLGFQDNSITLIDISDTSNILTVGVLNGTGSPNFLNGSNQLIVQDDKVYVASFGDSALVSLLWIQPLVPSVAEAEELPLSNVVQIGGILVLIIIILGAVFGRRKK